MRATSRSRTIPAAGWPGPRPMVVALSTPLPPAPDAARVIDRPLHGLLEPPPLGMALAPPPVVPLVALAPPPVVPPPALWAPPVVVDPPKVGTVPVTPAAAP